MFQLFNRKGLAVILCLIWSLSAFGAVPESLGEKLGT